jgi:hypothetical protein
MADKTESEYLEVSPDTEHHAAMSDNKVPLINKAEADDALQMALDSQGDTWTEEEEARVLRKIDFIMVPMVCNQSSFTCDLMLRPEEIRCLLMGSTALHRLTHRLRRWSGIRLRSAVRSRGGYEVVCV